MTIQDSMPPITALRQPGANVVAEASPRFHWMAWFPRAGICQTAQAL